MIAAGKLTVAVSGPREVFDSIEPVLNVFGRSVTYVGEGEVARLVKIAHNLMLGVVTQCLAEITVLVEKGGVSRADFLAFLNDSVMGSVFTQYKSPAFVNLDFTPTFTMAVAAEGLRPRARGGLPAQVADAHRLGDPADRRAGRRSGARRRRGLRDAAAGGGPRRRRHAGAGERPGRRRARAGAFMTAARPLGAPGHMGVDYEERVDFGRLRDYRIARAKAALEASGCGAFLLFDFYNIRYTTQTWIGGALGDKMIRYCLLMRDRDPILWDFGSAVRHHKLYSPWLPHENWRPGFLGLPRRGRAGCRSDA